MDTYIPIIIPGVLKLSSKHAGTSKTRGYLMKEFEPAFGIGNAFMVKTDKKDYTDKYVIVRIIFNIDKISEKKYITGVIERYLGDVGDIETEKEMCKIMSTSHWSRKYDRIDNSLSLSIDDLTPERINLFDDKDTMTLSVDPLGSMDIDDAISIKIIDNDNIIIGIHIADPSSYLIEGSDLDLEVMKRSESIYLMDKTFHMFPDHLSTDIFSLKADRINRAFSVIINVMKNKHNEWQIIKKTVTKSLININRNMTYEQFQSIHTDDVKMLSMYQIGKSLYNQYLDKENIIEYDSKKMIEIFMVLANCTVAEEMVSISLSNAISYPIILRSQKASGYQIDTDMVDKDMIEQHIKLHMNQAQIILYNPMKDLSKDMAHAALGLNLYTHFTSPIRRYSDIMVHRIMWNLLTYGKEEYSKSKKFLLPNLSVVQIQHMNYYKQFYKRVYNLQSELEIVHYYIKSIGHDPMNRVHEMQGIVMDIIYDGIRIDKIKVKCTNINDYESSERDTEDMTPDILGKLNDMYKNMIHMITITDSEYDIKLFQPIKYKVCYLARDCRKLRFFL